MNGGDPVSCFEITAELLISLGFTPDSGGYMLNGEFVWHEAGTWRHGSSGLPRVIKSNADLLAVVELAETEIV